MDQAILEVAGALWPVLLCTAFAIAVYRRVLRPRIGHEFARLSTRTIVAASPPAVVMSELLWRIYGHDHPVDEVVAGVLGGAGANPRGDDLTISTRTLVDYQLRRVDPQTYELRLAVRHSFKESVTDHRFAIFATCDPDLRDALALATRVPLYESWFVPNPALFEKSVDEISSSAHLGIEYVDLDGSHHRVNPVRAALSEVSYRDWPEFLTLFRQPVGNMPKQSPISYLRSLRIFEFDLGELADVDHAVGSIRSMSLISTSLQPFGDPFCFWQAPYPCYLERVGFDATGLGWDGDDPLLFRVVPFTFRSALMSGRWIPAEALADLSVRSWLLPGHGVALMWKPSTNDNNHFD
ncbi:MAG TPA: hypothetical protein VGJ95_01710 [Pseudonocardiaceae bacterium]